VAESPDKAVSAHYQFIALDMIEKKLQGDVTMSKRSIRDLEKEAQAKKDL